jgi:penicillin-binding protein A
MNKPITRLFGLVVVMFALLIAFTSRWTVFDAKALQDNPLNKRTLLETLDIKRGSIFADNGALLADSIRKPNGTYKREYPEGSLFAPAVGYALTLQGRYAGLESFRNSVLTGTPLEHQSVIDQLGGAQTAGDDVYTTLDPSAQQVAMNDLEATHLTGAVVAMVPSTGAIKVFASDPSYDPNGIANNTAGGSQFDRVTLARDQPGSIQKVVTAIAAIDTGLYTPFSPLVDGNSPQSFEGIPLNNDGDTSYGNINLTDGLTQSVNTVYANVAQHLGTTILAKYMYRLGYYRKPPIDLPSGELTASGVRTTLTGPLLPLDKTDIPLVGIGEGELEVTPLQMVMVASAVANGGRLMTPHLTKRIVNADGVTVQQIQPTLYSTVMKPSTATAVDTMMRGVVSDGTAAKALAGFKIIVAGKTGTAELGNTTNSPNDAWFIAFAPYKDIAVAVVVENTFDYGASAAAPIARDVIQSLAGSAG